MLFYKYMSNLELRKWRLPFCNVNEMLKILDYYKVMKTWRLLHFFDITYNFGLPLGKNVIIISNLF